MKKLKSCLLIITLFLNPYSYKTKNKAFFALINRFTEKQLTPLKIVLINTGSQGPVLMQTSRVHLKQSLVIVHAT